MGLLRLSEWAKVKASLRWPVGWEIDVPSVTSKRGRLRSSCCNYTVYTAERMYFAGGLIVFHLNVT